MKSHSTFSRETMISTSQPAKSDARLDAFKSYHGRTFASPPRLLEISGPLTISRLLDSATPFNSRNPGDFWFLDSDLTRLKQEAMREQKKERHDTRDQKIRFQVLLALRSQLAVSSQWSVIDRIVTLTIPAGVSLLAAVGKAKSQPYYDSNYEVQKDRMGQDKLDRSQQTGIGLPSGQEALQRSRVCDRKGITLPGGMTQIVIDFNHTHNRAARTRCLLAGPQRL